MLQIGRYNTLVVQRKVDFGLYLNPKEEEVLLPSKYVPRNIRPGDSLQVFVYTDSEDRPVATTLKPKAVVGETAHLEMKEGHRYVVKVLLDPKTNRVYGSARIARHCIKAPKALHAGQQVSLMIYQFSKLGTLAVVDHQYLGLIYHSDIFEELRIGSRRPGYIRRIRQDGKIDLSLKKTGPAAQSDSGRRIMEALQKAGGFLPCHDKTDPQEIMERFQMSKKEFKRTIGGLYKKRLITITSQGVHLGSPERPNRE